MITIVLKSVLAGLAAVVLYVLFSFLVPILAIGVVDVASTGSGGIGAVSFGLNAGVALAFFAIGFIWQFRRGRAKKRTLS